MKDFKLKLINVFRGYNYGNIIIDEVIPTFHDQARTSNKTVFRLKRVIAGNKALFVDKYNSEQVLFYHKQKLVSQNQTPIRTFDEKFNNGVFNKSFEKEGYVVNQMYEFRGLGYLGNLKDVLVVKLVTDQYVVFENSEGYIVLYSFEELNRLLKTRLS